MAQRPVGRITREQLRDLVQSGDVDTVISAVCDMQGRLMGKRVRADFFVEHVLEHGTHFCTYLLGTDIEMNTPEGFALTSWGSGYGDWLAQPDWNTLRLIPWLEKTALVLADAAFDEAGELVPIAPRTILRRQIDRASGLGFRIKAASELEFYLLKQSFEEAETRDFQGITPFGWYNEDYNLLQATKAEPIYRQFRNLMSQADVPVEFSKGEAAPGQHEVNIHFGDALDSADQHALFKHGAKEIAFEQGHAITFMAKPHHSWTGSSGHIHISLWDQAGQRNLFSAEGDHSTTMSDIMRYFLGGMMACARALSLFLASNVNSYKRYAVASWAPVNIVWGRDNRSCGFRVVGRGSSLRIENRFPGGDTNPYLAYAAMIAAGIWGIEHRVELPPEYQGNGYVATGVPRVPRTLYEAIETLQASEMARQVLGDDVVDHYLNMARVEQNAYDSVVTDWERRRYLERI